MEKAENWVYKSRLTNQAILTAESALWVGTFERFFIDFMAILLYEFSKIVKIVKIVKMNTIFIIL